MRKLKLLLTSICLIMLLSASTVFGAVTSVPQLEPMAENYLGAYASIKQSGSTVTVSGVIEGKFGQTTKTSVHLYLQQYKSGKWVSIADWTTTVNADSASLSKSKTVTKGYKYRAKAVCAAYVGSDKETVTKYSNAVSY